MKKLRLELNLERDKFYDYCHHEYKPNIDYKNKLRSIKLLLHSFDITKCKKEFYDLLDSIKKNFGFNNTVWGVKKEGNNIFWEFYFYNWQEIDKINISNFLKISEPFFTTKIYPNENIRYFMFSLDITKELLLKKKLRGLQVYVPGCCYFLDKTGMTFENYYTFYKHKKEIKRLVSDIKNSAIVDFTKIKLSDILWPELIDCHSICRARKRKNDAVYYNRVNINQFLFFLKKTNYPHELVSFIKKNKSRLDHLFYDVGFDYKMENNKLKIIKSGYYGTF